MKTLKMTKRKRPIPFDFVFEAIDGMSPYTKPMFGCTAVYVDGKIVFVLRERSDYIKDNGVWIATTLEHHKSLKNVFPFMRSLAMFGPKSTGWQVLPSDAPDFEESVLKACDMVATRDPRIGKIPNVKSRPSAKRKSCSKK